MSWFHKDKGGGGKVKPILKHADYTAILGVECEGGRLAKLCYTGHAGITETGVVQAIAFPAGGDPHAIWRADLANERDLDDGHVAVAAGVVVTRAAEKPGQVVIGHRLWTGEDAWRVPVAPLVSHMGLSGDTIVFVTFDHAVHAIDIATGKHELRAPVATDQARDRVMADKKKPRPTFQAENGSRASDEWSDARHVAPGLTVYERDWAGTREIGIGAGAAGAAHPHLVGRGSYNGSQRCGHDAIVLSFDIDVGGTEHHHWYIYSAKDPSLLAVMRADGASQLFDAAGKAIWTGKL